MMVIRPVERSDVSALMQLASKTGGGLTSLPANEATLSARIERAIKTWQGELPKSEQGYVFVLEDSESGTVAGICAIEVAVGLNDPWYNYRVGTLVHASKELNVYNALPTLFLSNDHTGSSEHAVSRPGVAQRGQRLFAVEIALYVYGGFSRQV